MSKHTPTLTRKIGSIRFCNDCQLACYDEEKMQWIGDHIGRNSRYSQHVTVPVSQLTKLAFGRSFRYFIKVKGVDVRISKDLYMIIKRIVED